MQTLSYHSRRINSHQILANFRYFSFLNPIEKWQRERSRCVRLSYWEERSFAFWADARVLHRTHDTSGHTNAANSAARSNGIVGSNFRKVLLTPPKNPNFSLIRLA